MSNKSNWSCVSLASGISLRFKGEQLALFRPKELSLNEVRLYPGSDLILGGPGSTAGWWLAWGRFNGRRAVTDVDFKVEADRTGIRIDTRGLDVESRDAVSEATAHISFDPAANTFVFDVATKLTVLEGKSLTWGPYTDLYEGLEFLNVLPTGIFNDEGASPIDDLGRCNVRGWHGQERYRGWAYQDAQRQWKFLPLNHIANSDSYAIRVCRGSKWILVGEADRAPTVEILGDTWKHAHFGLCHHMYDMHFNYLPDTNPVRGEAVLRAHFRLYNSPRQVADRAWRRAQPVPVPARERRATNFPISTISGIDLFSEGVHFESYDPRRFWKPYIKGSRDSVRQWRDRKFVVDHVSIQRYRIPQSDKLRFGWQPVCDGRSGGFAWMEADEDNVIGWTMNGGRPYIAERLYTVSAYVRVRNVKGEGAAIGVRPWSRKEVTWSRRLTGDSDWQRLGIEIPPPGTHLHHTDEAPAMDFAYERVDLFLDLTGTGRVEIAEVRYGSVHPNRPPAQTEKEPDLCSR